LPLKHGQLGLYLSDSCGRHRNLVWRQGCQKHVLDLCINAAGAHSLAVSLAAADPVLLAVVHRILAVMARAVQHHASAASTAVGDALQQRITLERRAGALCRAPGRSAERRETLPARRLWLAMNSSQPM